MSIFNTSGILYETSGIVFRVAPPPTATYGRCVSIDTGSSAGTSGTVGVIPYTGWQIVSGFPNFTGKTFADDLGSTMIGATISQVGGSSNNNALDADDGSDTWDMFKRGVAENDSTGSKLAWTFSGITYSKFDVYVYITTSSYSAVGTYSLQYESEAKIFGQTSANGMLQDNSYAFVECVGTDSGTANAGNYFRFAGKTDSGFTITTDDVTEPILATGIQIVQRTD